MTVPRLGDVYRFRRRDLVFAGLGALCGAVIGRRVWEASPTDQELRSQLIDNPKFLVDNPEIMDAAYREMEKQRLGQQAKWREEIIRTKWGGLFYEIMTPSIGPSEAENVLIEFTDYTCAPCRVSAGPIHNFLEKNKTFRLVVLFLPIGGPVAEYAARIAIACYRADFANFPKLHQTLMTDAALVNQDTIENVVAAMNYDVRQIRADAAKPTVKNHLQQIRSCATEFGFSGVPVFMTKNGRLLLGAATEQGLSNLIN